jgi:hypothetical protein
MLLKLRILNLVKIYLIVIIKASNIFMQNYDYYKTDFTNK